jgi:hypothetical protein
MPLSRCKIGVGRLAGRAGKPEYLPVKNSAEVRKLGRAEVFNSICFLEERVKLNQGATLSINIFGAKGFFVFKHDYTN